MSLRATILGCGPSYGVPRIGGIWGACDPGEPKNRRTRCSLLVEQFGESTDSTAVLVDTGPDVREQLLAANVGHSEAVGGEIALHGAASGWRWDLSYAFVSTTDHTSLNRGAVQTAAVDYALSTPRHVIAAGIGYSHDRWELDASARWQSGYRDFQAIGTGFLLREAEIRNYVTLNARAGFRLTDNVTLALVAQQFNTPRLYQAAGAPVERLLIGTLSARF